MQLGINNEFLNVYIHKKDEDVVELAKKDSIALEYLIRKYKNVVRTKARPYYLIGADKEDIVQEGMIGLYRAICDYDKEKSTSFKVFADICITRQMITAIKAATRQKHIPLNTYISLNKPVYSDESERTLLDIMSGFEIADPEELMINEEELKTMEAKLGDVLSSLELRVIKSYAAGMSYQEIADDLNKHVKSVDNALQRVKKKVEKLSRN